MSPGTASSSAIGPARRLADLPRASPALRVSLMLGPAGDASLSQRTAVGRAWLFLLVHVPDSSSRWAALSTSSFNTLRPDVLFPCAFVSQKLIIIGCSGLNLSLNANGLNSNAVFFH